MMAVLLAVVLHEKWRLYGPLESPCGGRFQTILCCVG